MTNKRAWCFIDTMNPYFREPVVTSVKGGPTGGGASLIETGKAVRALYRTIQRKAESAISAELKRLATPPIFQACNRLAPLASL